MEQNADVIDHMMADWKAVRPELDPSPLGLVGRVIVLARHLEQSIETRLKAHDLTLGQFDILATLRRHEPNGGMNPTELCENVMLTSGGMTSRLDRLEATQLIARKANPNDRRGVVVVLTAKGRKVIDAATATRFEEAAQSMPVLSKSERKHLEQALRQWLGQFTA